MHRDQKWTVKEIKIHPGYRLETKRGYKSKSYSDIAILILENSISFDNFTQSVCLLNSYETFIDSTVGYVVGYENQNNLKHFNLTVQESITCHEAHTNAGNVLRERSFCANGTNSLVCQGKL